MKTTTAQNIIISKTAYCTGYGTDRYKHSAGLSKIERDAVHNGDIIIITDCRPAGGNHGTTLRVATHDAWGWGRRLPSDDEIKAAMMLLTK